MASGHYSDSKGHLSAAAKDIIMSHMRRTQPVRPSNELMTASSQDAICSMCKKPHAHMHSHHVIPRFMGGTDEDLIPLCPRCHAKADAKMKQLVFDPWGRGIGKQWKNKMRVKRYASRNLKTKWITTIKVGDGVNIMISARYNNNAGSVGIYSTWKYNKPREAFWGPNVIWVKLEELQVEKVDDITMFVFIRMSYNKHTDLLVIHNDIRKMTPKGLSILVW